MKCFYVLYYKVLRSQVKGEDTGNFC